MSLKDLPDGPTILSVADLQAMANGPAVTNKEHTRVAIADLTYYPGNARVSDLQPLADSLEAFGQYADVLVQRSTGYIVVGNHRTRAASEKLGWTEIDVCIADMSDDHARALVAADNKLGEIGGYDPKLHAELLTAVSESGLLAITGHSYTDLTESILKANALNKTEEEERWGEDHENPVLLVVSKSFQIPAKFLPTVEAALEKASDGNVPGAVGNGPGWALVRICEDYLTW